jgi:tetratricopeptide (TPR) repeat protein
MMTDFFKEPLAVEALVALVFTVVLYLLLRGLRGVAARIARRKALVEFVTGVDLYFKGEFEQARTALLRVIERDPENSEARILLGDACRELGDLAEAHKHHYQVARVFGQDLPRNRLSLGMDLLEMGQPEKALEHLRRVASADPSDRGTSELILAACLQAGRHEEALSTARRLAETSRDADEEARHRRQQARVAAILGHEQVEGGNHREGIQLLRTAVKLNAGLVAPRLEIVRATYVNGSARAAEKELVAQLTEMSGLAERGTVFEPPERPRIAVRPDGEEAGLVTSPARIREALPAPESPALLTGPGASEAEVAPREPAGPVARVEKHEAALTDQIPEPPMQVESGRFVELLLPREAAYVCTRCGRAEISFADTCAGCGVFGSLRATDESTLAGVPGMKEAFDEILENRAWVRSLLARAAAGDAVAGDKLVATGPKVIRAIFRELLRAGENAALVRVLSRMGPDAVPQILEGYRRATSFSTKRLVRERMRAFRSLDNLLVRVLAGMGADVIPALDELVKDGERGLRLVVVDVLIRLGDAERVEELRPVISSKELMDRLNGCAPEELVAFVDAAPRDGYLVDQVFVDRTFTGEKALVGALGRSGDRGKIRQVLINRGFSSTTYEALEERWADPTIGRVVSDVIRSFGPAAVDHLVQTFTTAEVPEGAKAEALLLLRNQGGNEIERLVERLAEGDPESERATLRIIRAFGNRAVPPIERVYGRTGLLAKVGLNRRRLQHRKATLARALGQIGTYEAILALRRLNEKESDPEVRRRFAIVLDRLARKEIEE